MELLQDGMTVPGEPVLTPDMVLDLCRSGEASLLPAQPQDSPFVTINVNDNGTVGTNVRYPILEPGPDLQLEPELLRHNPVAEL